MTGIDVSPLPRDVIDLFPDTRCSLTERTRRTEREAVMPSQNLAANSSPVVLGEFRHMGDGIRVAPADCCSKVRLVNELEVSVAQLVEDV